jgi:hypothetical protein
LRPRDTFSPLTRFNVAELVIAPATSDRTRVAELVIAPATSGRTRRRDFATRFRKRRGRR